MEIFRSWETTETEVDEMPYWCWCTNWQRQIRFQFELWIKNIK